ncbi:MAG TPA: OmpA family protein [Burkholderiaceae bacterium]|jgi:OOP family OmpA-OmpF porin|nr:OmpA family protein [Burkholderiaceae bacterium]
MNKLVKLVFAASAVVAFSASAQVPTIKLPAPNPGYLADGSGNVVLSGTGNCVHTGVWTPANATVIGCDGVVAKAAVVVVPPPPEPAPVAPPPPPEPVPVPVSEKVTYAADTFFDFDKAVLKPEGKAKLDELVTRVQGMDLEVAIATGHTDNIGPAAYNQKLSLRRANAVKAYMVSKGIDASRIYTDGKGKTQPIADNKTPEGRAKNRRTEVELVGIRTTLKTGSK